MTRKAVGAVREMFNDKKREREVKPAPPLSPAVAEEAELGGKALAESEGRGGGGVGFGGNEHDFVGDGGG